MNAKAYKQTRLDLYEIRERWPKLRELNWWDTETITKARRMSERLYRADVRLCEVNAEQYKKAEAEMEKAEKTARLMRKALNMLFSSMVEEDERADLPSASIEATGYGFRYISLTGGGNVYDFLD